MRAALTGSRVNVSNLTLITLRGADANQAAALSGMSQSVGYLLAALVSPAMGILHDATGGWTAALVLCLILSSAMVIIGFHAGASHASS